MLEKFVKKALRGIGVLLVMAAIVFSAATLRFAIYAPEMLHQIFHTIGG